MRYELSDYEWTAIKPHAVVDTNDLPVHLALTPGEAHNNRLCVATRYDELGANYLAFIKLASIRIWLRAK